MKKNAIAALPWARSLRWLLLAVLGSLLACGGGEDHAGVGTGGTGLKEGVVTGFGSVYIDGTRYDNSQAVVQVNDGSATLASGQLKLGQRVRAQISADGQLRSAEILPALIGPVELAPDAQGYLRVMGQWVRLVSKDLPYAATLSSSTYLSGYGTISEIAVGDVVEVHGAWYGADTSYGRVLVASRLEQRADAPQRLLLSGPVASASVGSFSLTTADGRRVVAASSSTVAVGDWVGVWVEAAAVPQWNAAAQISATRWTSGTLAPGAASDDISIEVSGLPEQYNAQTGAVRVQGLSLQLPAALATPAVQAALQAGIFTRFLIARDAGKSTWTVRSVTPREGNSLGQAAVVMQQGVAAGLAPGTTDVMVLRDVQIEISDSLLQASGCATLPRTAAITVRVTGRPVGSRLAADTLECILAQPP